MASIQYFIYGNCTFHIPRNLTDVLASPALTLICMVALMKSIWLDQRSVDMRPSACTVALDLLPPRQNPSRGHRLTDDADVLTADPRLQLSHESVIELAYLYVGFCIAALVFHSIMQRCSCSSATFQRCFTFSVIRGSLACSHGFQVLHTSSLMALVHPGLDFTGNEPYLPKLVFTVCITVLPGFVLTCIHGGMQMVTALASGARGFLRSSATQHR